MKPGNKERTPNDYYEWIKKFGYLQNHLVFFSDDQNVLNYMASIRTNKKTTLMFVDRRKLIGFRNIEQIKEIFKLPGFGVFPEETGNYNYSAIMHSKHDMVRRAIMLFGNESSYFAWVDIGLFRYASPVEDFELKHSQYIENGRILMSQAFPFKDETIESIIKNARTWISGAMMAGHVDSMLKFCNVYEEFFKKLISMKLIATDEQVIYALYSSQGQKLVIDIPKLSVFQCDYFGLYLLFTPMPTTDKCP
ncbi:uncharacterized protein LOC115232266 [Octopus sinensis]|uniref:Uncharacterized protein LOC115232266 n=1 Tax=Octopus sinensis TaxID=2607531 RepID=A0A6P7TZS7_9MOLL|nr:uncharacterized protein LOC115232266 [Octopus sinensis]